MNKKILLVSSIISSVLVGLLIGIFIDRTFLVDDDSSKTADKNVNITKSVNVEVEISNACNPFDAHIVRFQVPKSNDEDAFHQDEISTWLNLSSLSDIKFSTTYFGKITNEDYTIGVVFQTSKDGYLYGEYTLYDEGVDRETKSFKVKANMEDNKEMCG